MLKSTSFLAVKARWNMRMFRQISMHSSWTRTSLVIIENPYTTSWQSEAFVTDKQRALNDIERGIRLWDARLQRTQKDYIPIPSSFWTNDH